MPQMMPMNWMILMTLTLMMIIILTMMSFFNFKPQLNITLSTQYKIHLPWMW